MQREITRKVSKLELCHLCAACLIIWIYIPIKVHPNTLNSFGVMEYTQKLVKKTDAKMCKVKKLQLEIIKKVIKLELSILSTVCLFMWVYIPTRYHPNILNSFEVIEHTKKIVKNAKGN